MKKLFFLLVAFLMATFTQAQVVVDMSQLFTIDDKYVDINEPMTVKDGIVFIGDTRPADKIQEGKYRGMRVQKSRRYFSVNGKGTEYPFSLSFRRAPQGATKDHAVDINMVPRSCMLQLKPTSDGQFAFYGLTNKPEGNNLYVAVVNGTSFKPLATLKFTKPDEQIGRSKKTPANAVICDYHFTAGDQLWIYSDGAVSLHALSFSGLIDKNFTGTDPVAAAKKIAKAKK